MNIINYIFPQKCTCCETFSNNWFCEKCIVKLCFSIAHCIYCQGSNMQGKTHKICTSKYNIINQNIILYIYNDVFKNFIINWKYKFLQYNTKKILQEIIRNGLLKGNYFKSLSLYKNIYLIPVPLSKYKLNWRGFNQAQVIAQTLSKVLKENNIKNEIKNNVLLKPKNNLTQARIETGMRYFNSYKTFVINKNQSKFLNDLKDDEPQTGKVSEMSGMFNSSNMLGNSKVSTNFILLVDDVISSGNTINEACLILNEFVNKDNKNNKENANSKNENEDFNHLNIGVFALARS